MGMLHPAVANGAGRKRFPCSERRSPWRRWLDPGQRFGTGKRRPHATGLQGRSVGQLEKSSSAHASLPQAKGRRALVTGRARHGATISLPDEPRRSRRAAQAAQRHRLPTATPRPASRRAVFLVLELDKPDRVVPHDVVPRIGHESLRCWGRQPRGGVDILDVALICSQLQIQKVNASAGPQ